MANASAVALPDNLIGPAELVLNDSGGAIHSGANCQTVVRPPVLLLGRHTAMSSSEPRRAIASASCARDHPPPLSPHQANLPEKLLLLQATQLLSASVPRIALLRQKVSLLPLSYNPLPCLQSPSFPLKVSWLNIPTETGDSSLMQLC